MLLLDWEKAFDKITHEWLFIALEGFNIPMEIMSLIKSMCENPTFYVSVGQDESDWAKQETGIRQGCPLSPYLFILVMDRLFEIIPEIAKEHERRLRIPRNRCKKPSLQTTFFSLLYADDTLLKHDNEEKLTAILHAIERVSEVFGLNLNKEKCRQLSYKGRAKRIKFLDGTEVPQEDTVEYLGTILHIEANPRPEIRKRISGAGHVRNKFTTFWAKACMNKRSKILHVRSNSKRKNAICIGSLTNTKQLLR